MQWNKISLRSLQYFVDCVESQSFKGAAFKNGVTTSALGQILKKLEKDIGMKLLDRKGHALETIINGKLLVEKIKLVLDILQERPAQLPQEN